MWRAALTSVVAAFALYAGALTHPFLSDDATHIAANPTVEEVLAWLIEHFIIGAHEVIAYSKLPEATFRFSWEESGRLRFFNPGGRGLGRFAPSDDRRGVMATLSEDLGYWTSDSEGKASLTLDGREFVAAMS